MIQDDQKGFIEELRALNEPTKRKILVGTVAVSMIVVIYLWLAYFNSIVLNTTSSVQPPGVVNAPVASETGGVLGLFATAMASLWQVIRDGAGTAIGAVENARQYNVSPR